MENENKEEKVYFTYGMIKPDGMPHIKEILESIYDAGLYVVYSKVDTLDENVIEENYSHCIGKDFYEGMKENLLSGYVLKMLILDPKGDAVRNYRKVLGATKPWEAEPNTIRGTFGDKKIAYKNVAHGSGNAKEAEDEIIRFFRGDLNNVFESVLNYGSYLAMSEFIKSNINDSTIVNKAFRDADVNAILDNYSKKVGEVMQQYFAKNDDLELEDGDYHHIKNVMRMKTGDTIKVVYNNTVNICKLTNVSNSVKFDVIEKEKKVNDGLIIDVAFALIKEQKLNYLLQKTTEVGVSNLIPINTKRCVVKLDKTKEESKLKRWKKILKEASEQSNRVDVPNILDVKNINELVSLDYDLKLLCSLNKNTKNIKKVLEKNNKCAKILLVIGPEGGFDKEEENFLLNNGFTSISLGENVLRAETAPVVALSMIKYEFMR